jgi:hypothetical protein
MKVPPVPLCDRGYRGRWLFHGCGKTANAPPNFALRELHHLKKIGASFNILAPMKYKILIILIIVLKGCGFSGGTHGSIKDYQYSVTKSELEKAVMAVLQTNSNVYRDTIRNYIIDVTDGKSDTIENNYYNDGTNYLTLHIKTLVDIMEYTIRYYADSMTWANSQTSEIFICYIYDGKGNGGSEGNGKWRQTSGSKQKKMINLFETEFINKLDRELNQKHIVAD